MLHYHKIRHIGWHNTLTWRSALFYSRATHAFAVSTVSNNVVVRLNPINKHPYISNDRKCNHSWWWVEHNMHKIRHEEISRILRKHLRYKTRYLIQIISNWSSHFCQTRRTMIFLSFPDFAFTWKQIHGSKQKWA